MSTKGTPIVTAYSGTLSPDSHNFEITTPSDLVAIVVDGLSASDAINIVRRNYDDSAWVPYTDGSGQVQLNVHNTSVAPLKAGNYGLDGIVDGTVTIYTEGP